MPYSLPNSPIQIPYFCITFRKLLGTLPQTNRWKYNLMKNYPLTTEQMAEKSFQALMEISDLVERAFDDQETLEVVVKKLQNHYGGSPELVVDDFLFEIEENLSFVRSGLEEAAYNMQQKANATK